MQQKAKDSEASHGEFEEFASGGIASGVEVWSPYVKGALERGTLTETLKEPFKEFAGGRVSGAGWIAVMRLLFLES